MRPPPELEPELLPELLLPELPLPELEPLLEPPPDLGCEPLLEPTELGSVRRRGCAPRSGVEAGLPPCV